MGEVIGGGYVNPWRVVPPGPHGYFVRIVNKMETPSLGTKHPASVDGPFALHLTARVRNRVSASDIAAQAIGLIEPGMTVTGVTKGRMSMLDFIEHVLETTGPADIDVST